MMKENVCCGYPENKRNDLPMFAATDVCAAKNTCKYHPVSDNSGRKCVMYEDFGAIGDGIADDSEAIRAAHNHANKHGLRVLGKEGASYRIGVVSSPIVVETTTDWNGAEVIFDDSEVRYDSKDRNVNVFLITSPDREKNIDVPVGMKLSKGQQRIELELEKACMLKIENSEEKIYKRYGENANGGVNKNEMILVDKEGNIDPTTPIQYDYSNVTKITAYPIDEEPISFGNGRAKTIAHNPKSVTPDYENHYCYYSRGILVKRSNVRLHNIEHRVYGEDLTIKIDRNGDGIIDYWGADKSYGVPYAGFFSFISCYNSGMVDCIVQGHQAYSFYQGATRYEKGTTRNEMGSYDLNATDCVNLSYSNIVQYENPENEEVITNRFMYHGVMGSNFCRNVLMENCYLDRFDSHQGVHNATIRNCTLGFGILVIGGGDLLIENVKRVSGRGFVHLRMDYNSVFDGDVVLKNCVAGADVGDIIQGRWVKHYNGLDNQITRSLTVDGLKAESGEMIFYELYGASPDSLIDDVNKLYPPRSITYSGIVGPDGVTEIVPKVCNVDGIFDSVKINN